MGISNEISGITLVYLIAIGFQIFVLLFIFAKRQIMRFSWGSKKEFHAPIAYGTAKSFRQQVVAQIPVAKAFIVEPVLAPLYKKDTVNYLNMKAMDDVNALDLDLKTFYCGITRKPREHIYVFLQRLSARQPVLDGVSVPELTQLGVLYEHARYGTKPFLEEDYYKYSTLLQKVIATIRRNHTLLPLVIDECEFSHPSSRPGGCFGGRQQITHRESSAMTSSSHLNLAGGTARKDSSTPGPLLGLVARAGGDGGPRRWSKWLPSFASSGKSDRSNRKESIL